MVPGGIVGIVVATMGVVMSCAYILAEDTCGPIIYNAGGITEMGGQAESVRDITDALDGVGNTTKALTKGYGIGSAALAAFLLFSAYLDVLFDAKKTPILNAHPNATPDQITQLINTSGIANVYHVDLTDITVFIAALIGIT